MLVQSSIFVSIFCWTLVSSLPYEYPSLERSTPNSHSETFKNNENKNDLSIINSVKVEEHLSIPLGSNDIHPRKRRDAKPCSLEKFYVGREFLGIPNALHEEINIGACVGHCPVSFNSFNTNYSIIRYTFLKRNSKYSLPKESWIPRCEITAMESMSLFVSNTVGNKTLIEEKLFENMGIKSCGCVSQEGFKSYHDIKMSHSCGGNNT